MIMESCLEGKYSNFNGDLWQLCQTSPQEGGLTTDQWLDLRDLKFMRHANQAEWARVTNALHYYFPFCPKCSHRQKKDSMKCNACGYILREPPAA